MTSPRIIPIIMCGGSGSRLWPASRESYPKQFLPLAGVRTLFQDTVLRVSDPDLFGAPIVIANADHRFIIAEQLQQIGVTGQIVLEPFRRDSAAALAAAARFAELRDPDALVIALASDHVVTDPAGFHAAIGLGVTAALAGRIVTFGIEPTEPTSKYGYIRPGAPLPDAPGVAAVGAFVEKPDRANAERFVADGYLWNSGNFLTLAGTLLGELRRLAPEIAGPATAAADKAAGDLDFLRLNAESFAAATAQSIDYAVMERTPLAAVVPGAFGWSDVGSWSALWELAARDEDGNALIGRSAALHARNCYVRSDKHMTAVVGVENLVVVATDDAILVTTRDQCESVKALVAKLVAGLEPTATRTLKAHSPWGASEIVDQGANFQVRRITVQPGRRLSLQSHAHRAEHWVVVSGSALVTIEGDRRTVAANESVYIAPGAVHRLENPHPTPLELIEVQSGSYFGDDDVVRLDDDYGPPS